MNLRDLYFSDPKYHHSWGYGDKGTAHNYIDTYNDLFEPIKNEKLSILEIGIMHGHSIRLWKSYFKNSIIFAADISPHCSNFKDENVNILIEDATTTSFSNKFKEEAFDIIIDDGSHVLEDQLKSFSNLYPKLKKGGIYIIEDILDLDQSYSYFEKLNPTKILDFRKLKNINSDVLIYWIKN